MSDPGLTNLIGALAIGIGDAQWRALRAVSGLGDSLNAALLTLDQSPGLPIRDLAGILGVTHSAAVRLVDDLVDRGLALRASGEDRRVRAILPSGDGAALAARLRAARAAVLCDAIASLDTEARATLRSILGTLLSAIVRDREASDHLCRICDEAACGGADCPVERHVTLLETRAGMTGATATP